MPSMPSYTRNALVGPPFTFYLFAWTWAVCAKRARPRGDNVQGTRVFPQTSPHPLFALYPNFHDYIELAFPQTRFLVAHNHYSLSIHLPRLLTKLTYRETRLPSINKSQEGKDKLEGFHIISTPTRVNPTRE